MVGPGAQGLHLKFSLNQRGQKHKCVVVKEVMAAPDFSKAAPHGATERKEIAITVEVVELFVVVV